MEDAYIVSGGKPLTGSVSLSGAKNVALKAIIASLLFDEKVTLKNIPQINDVTELLHLVQRLGAKVSFENNTVEIDPTTATINKVDLLHASKIRVSFMLFAPLLHLFKTCFVPNPGGCRIGARPIDRIIGGMEALGVEVTYDSSTGYYKATLKEAVGGTYRFEKPTHTGTELLIMLAVKGTSKVVLENAALEPEIDELITFLNAGGAQITRTETTITIEPTSSLVQKEPFTIVTDRNEAVTFATLALATKGDVTITNIAKKDLTTFFEYLKKTGAGIEEVNDHTTRFFYNGSLSPTDIETAPHPGFMTDWQPNWAVLMTQSEGVSTIHERVFEGRFSYVQELRKLGAKIEFVDAGVSEPADYYHFTYDQTKTYQQKVRISGPTRLHNGVLRVHDLRAGASVLIAALVAEGESDVQGASILERGYENFVEKVQNLGGQITKI